MQISFLFSSRNSSRAATCLAQPPSTVLAHILALFRQPPLLLPLAHLSSLQSARECSAPLRPAPPLDNRASRHKNNLELAAGLKTSGGLASCNKIKWPIMSRDEPSRARRRLLVRPLSSLLLRRYFYLYLNALRCHWPSLSALRANVFFPARHLEGRLEQTLRLALSAQTTRSA